MIVHHGVREMLQAQRDVFYYVTLMNENQPQPSVPPGCDYDIVRGLVRVGEGGAQVAQAQAAVGAPVVAVSDWVRAWPSTIAPYLDAKLTVLGTDGFGRSDTRAALRGFFEVNRHHVVLAALDALAARGQVAREVCAQALQRYCIDAGAPQPWGV
jgi:pyruvate dehydrogenase E1 component